MLEIKIVQSVCLLVLNNKEMLADGRTATVRPTPINALSEFERQAIVALCNSKSYAHLPPSQIVPQLADENRYIASEATFYRVLHTAGQQHHRSRAKRPHRHEAPTTYAATVANQVWSWDIKYGSVQVAATRHEHDRHRPYIPLTFGRRGITFFPSSRLYIEAGYGEAVKPYGPEESAGFPC